MKLWKVALLSPGIFAIAGSSAIADPAAGNPYTQNPTSQERAQTEQLNTQAASDAQTPPQPTAADEAQYRAQQRQYQDDQARYRALLDRYRDERAEFFYDRSHPYTWWHDRYERASLDLFYGMPQEDLIDLRVVRDDGFTIGRIRGYERAPDGRVAAVKIVYRDGGVAWIRARNLRYDPDERLVFTDLTVPELRDLARNS